MNPRVVLVGECNPYQRLGDDDAGRFDLWPDPPHAAGGRLMRKLGLSRRTYLDKKVIERRNLCRGEWWLRSARAAAQELLRREEPAVFVMLGAKVARAFGVELPDFTSVELWASRGQVLVRLPHPSGRCRVWNGSTSLGRAREVLRRAAPWVPWGEEEGHELLGPHEVAKAVVELEGAHHPKR